MIFVLRAIMVSFAFFAIVYTFVSFVVVVISQILRLFHLQKHLGACSLITLRILPFIISAGISVFLTLPSFLLLERHALDEDLGTFVLSACAIMLLGVGVYRVWTAEARTRRVLDECLQGATDVKARGIAPALTLARNIAPLMLIGIRTPRILISTSASEMLSDAELTAAVRHEQAHFRSRDNLKKAILNCLPFPGMTPLEHAWQEASEFAADEGAVATRGEALDLASALIKLARHLPSADVPELATGLVTTVASVTNRVERLVAWKEPPAGSPSRLPYAIAAALVGFFGLVANLGPALILVHSLTERLVP